MRTGTLLIIVVLMCAQASTPQVASVQQAIAGVFSGLLQYDPENSKAIIADLAEEAHL